MQVKLKISHVKSGELNEEDNVTKNKRRCHRNNIYQPSNKQKVISS